MAAQWIWKYTTTNEVDEAERWEFLYARATPLALIEIASLDALPEEGPERVQAMLTACQMVIRRAIRDGIPVDIQSVPFDVLMEALEHHPTFQGESTAPGAVFDRSGARGGASGTPDGGA